MFKNREILCELDYLKEVSARIESLLRLICNNESRLEEKIDDIKNTLVNVTSKNVLDEFDHIISSVNLSSKNVLEEFDYVASSFQKLKDSIFECQKMMNQDKGCIPLTTEEKKNSNSNKMKKSGMK